MPSPHDVLGVGREATPDQIKAAYRRLAQKHHPDKGGGAEAAHRFQAIQDAYRTLTQPQAPLESPRQASGHDWFEEMFSHLHGAPLYTVTLTPQQARDGGRLSMTHPDGRPVQHVQLPAGLRHGQRLRIGDSWVSVEVALPAGWVREGADLVHAVDVDYWVLALGGALRWTHWTGEIRQTEVPAGMQPHQRLRLRGAGEGGGDVFLALVVKVPTALSEPARGLLRQFAQAVQNPG